MSTESQIRDVAAQLAGAATQKMPALESAMVDVDMRKVALEREWHAASAIEGRLKTFQAILDGEYQCPYCYVSDGKKVALKAIGRPDGGEDADYYRCNSPANHEVVISVRAQ